MKKFEVTILGSNAAMPLLDRHTSSQIVNFNENLFLIDCGDGTQLQLSKFKIKRSRINHIFISHLHGDHCYGLPGLLTTYNHFSRSKALHLYGVKGIKDFIEDVFKHSYVYLQYPLIIHELEHDTSTLIMENEFLSVESIPLAHRVPCLGYVFKEKPYKHLSSKAIKEYSMSIEEIKEIKRGGHLLRNNEVVESSLLFEKMMDCRGYAYMSDTTYFPDNSKYLENITTIYHEATYLDQLRDLAKERGHSTAKEAAQMATLIGAKRLLLGHFSGRYDKKQVFREEAKLFFHNPIITKDGEIYSV